MGKYVLKNTSLSTNALIYFASNLINALVPFILLPVLTRYLPPEEYGYVALFTIFSACAVALISFGVGGAVTRQYYHLDKSEFSEFVGAGVLLVGFAVCISILVVFIVMSAFQNYRPLPLSWMLLAILSAGGLSIYNIWLAFLQVSVKPIQYGLFQVSQTALNVIVSLVLVVGFSMGGLGRVLGQLSALIIFAVIAVWFFWTSGWLKFSLKGTHLRWLLGFGVPIVPHALSGIIISMSDRLVLSHVSGAAALGVYAVAVQVSMIMTMLVDSFNKAYVPWLYARLALDDEGVKRKLALMTYVYFIAVLVLAVALGIIVPPLISFFTGEKYVGAGEFQLWLFLAGSFTGMYYMVGLYINYSAKNKYLSLASGTAALFTPLICYYLVTVNGAVGAAQGALAGQVLLFLLTWFFSMRAYPMPWFHK